MQIVLPKLEYSLSHPHPRNNLFLVFTVLLFLIAVPILVLVNIVTLGYELVPSLQPQFQPNETLAHWWGSARLPKLLRSRTPQCEPRDLGRGDTFRLSASLFDYEVMSTWNTTEASSNSNVQEQKRVEYRGELFDTCHVTTTQFDFSLLDDTQTVTVGVICPGTPEYPVYVSMQTKMVFAWLLSKDFVGQYYGPGLNLMGIDHADPNDYRKLAFAVLEAISTDSLTIMRGKHLSSPVLSITAFFNTTFIDGKIDTTPMSNLFTYLNGSEMDWPAEAGIYAVPIINLMNVAAHTVNLDLGSAGPENIYLNSSVLNMTIGPNLAPPGIAPANWAQNSVSFYYGKITPPYETWAQMLRARQTIVLGNATGLPVNSTMVTTYLCPTYQLKPIRSLLTSIFVGTATMFLSVWAAWMFITTFIARRLEPPCLDCKCPKCLRKSSTEAKMGANVSPVVPGSSNDHASEVTDEKPNPEQPRPANPPRFSQIFGSGLLGKK
ncbi:hypothetical protein BDV93DRAFT_610107 [Ceratobasidium sp. AG-I]|nr:hypothetical protein BDV93DRAFT_610107 [Ceratobasidium sp. AG-I]